MCTAIELPVGYHCPLLYDVRLILPRLFACVSFVSLGVGCEAPARAPVVSSPSTSASSTRSAPASARPATSPPGSPSTSPSAAPPNAPPDAAAIYARLEHDLALCYEQGRKSTPSMLDARLTLNASIDATGTPTCVIPSDHTGLTQDVEDCMSARFAKEKFDDGSPWSASVPVVIRAGTLKLGERRSDAVVIASVETIRMPDAFEVVESLETDLQACLRGIEKGSGLKSMLVAARIGADGRAQCALASSPGVLPEGVGACAAGVLRSAKFPPPKRGSGLVLVPILVQTR